MLPWAADRMDSMGVSVVTAALMAVPTEAHRSIWLPWKEGRPFTDPSRV